MTRRVLTLAAIAIAGSGICTVGGAASAGSPANRDVAQQIVNVDRGTVVIYEDGRVYQRADMGTWTAASGFGPVTKMAPPAPPGAYEWATMSADAVVGLLDRIEALGLADDDIDFGDPMVTDSPSSDLVVTIDGTTVQHHVYAPGYTDGLSQDQQANRAAYDDLRSILFRLDDTFGEEISEFAPYIPIQWVVGTGMYWADDVVRPWPLDDDPVDGDCVVLATDGITDTASGGYLFRGDIVVVDPALPNDKRCASSVATT